MNTLTKESLSKRLTLRYGLYQLFYFAATAGTGGFAATYLMDKGLAMSQIGLILAMINIVSCLLQPFLGDIADRLKGFVLPKMLGILFLIAGVCYMVLQVFSPTAWGISVLYIVGGVTVSVATAISNAVCAYYAKRNYQINFGLGAAAGSLSYSLASLGLGYMISGLGVDWMIWITLLFLGILICLVLGYPKVEERTQEMDKTKPHKGDTISLISFSKKYKYFTGTVVGIMFIAMCHAMSENYLINLFERMGGGSEHVGTALFIACISAVPFLTVFDRVQAKTGVFILMRLSGIFYALKAFLLMQASTVTGVYLIVLLQSCTYGFMYPAIYYFAKDRIGDSDMAKGQALAMSLYTLGLAFGSYAGGKLIEVLGLNPMLFGAMLCAGVGAVLINLMIKKDDLKQ